MQDIEPQAWRLNINSSGRPSIINETSPAWLNFNLSHTEDFIVCAISSNPQVGVDVEKIKSDKALLEIALENFSNEESNLLVSKAESEQALLFFKLFSILLCFI